MNTTVEPTRSETSMLLLAVVLALAVGCTPTPIPTRNASLPPPTTPGPSTPVPTPTPQASPSASAHAPSSPAPPRIPPTTWDQVFALEQGSLGSLANWREGLIGAGCIEDSDGSCDQEIVVASADGHEWDVIEVDAPADVGFGSVHRAGGRLYALGYGHYGGSGGAVVWTSVDGRDWSRVKSGSFVGRAVGDVIGTPHGTFAVGYNAPVDSDNTTGFVTWPVNGDGSFGTMRAHDTGSSFRLVTGVVWTGTEFLAWGGRDGAWPSRITTVLSSRDAKTWSPRGEILAVKRGYVAQIISVGDRLVAVGYEGRRFPLAPQAWTSIDGGRTWKPADVDSVDARMSSVTLEGSQLVARGLQSWGPDELAVSWTSRNGKSWASLPSDQDLPAILGFSGLTRVAIGNRTCVAGSFYDETPTGAAIYCRASG